MRLLLTQGKYAIVDDEDFEYLNQWKWFYANGYALRDVRKDNKVTHIWMHRLINETPTGLETDHINGDGLDNRKSNLRSCTAQENQRNKSRQSNNSSGYIGVIYDKGMKRVRRWRAQLYINKNRVHLGYFLTKQEAAQAYRKASLEHFGEFAYLIKEREND